MRSHQLTPGQQTLVDIAFLTDVDGPGQHGEAIDLLANDPHLPHHQPPSHDLWFLITVHP